MLLNLHEIIKMELIVTIPQQQRRIYENILTPIQDRSDRFYIDDKGVFYKTREGEIRGPFSTQSVAEFDLECFIQSAIYDQEDQERLILANA